MTAASHYFALTKPRILPLVLFTGLAALGVSGQSPISLPIMTGVLLGIALSAGCANALNAFIESDRDALMERTKNRPIPSGKIPGAHALAFSLSIT